jgi:hypothetical protein
MKTSQITMLLVIGTGLVMFLSGCSSVSVSTDYDRSVPFRTYRTYALEPPSQVPPLSPSADSALRNTLRETLAARGIREVDLADKPDLAVVPHVRLQQQYSVDQYTQWGYAGGAWPYRAGYYGVWAGAPATYTTINNYTEGTLLLDFVDTSKQKLVFRGAGTGTMGSPESNAKKIQEAVTKIVEKFPAANQPAANQP